MRDSEIEPEEDPLATAALHSRIFGVLIGCASIGVTALLSGCALFNGSGTLRVPTVTITADPGTVAANQTSILTITAADAVTLSITGSDGTSYHLGTAGGILAVKPSASTT